MVRKTGAVVGIDCANNIKAYRALLIAFEKNETTGECKWKFQPKMLSEEQIISSCNSGMNWINIDIVKGKVHGSAGDLKRFEPKNGNRPFVIIAQTSNSNGKIIGYIVANYDGKVTRVSLKQLIAYGNNATKKDNVVLP